MSKLQTFDKPIHDEYQEHIYHQSYHQGCSECFKERRALRAFKLVNDKRLREELGTSIHEYKLIDGRISPNPLER